MGSSTDASAGSVSECDSPVNKSRTQTPPAALTPALQRGQSPRYSPPQHPPLTSFSPVRAERELSHNGQFFGEPGQQFRSLPDGFGPLRRPPGYYQRVL